MKIGEVEEGKGKEGGRRDGTGTMNESVQKMWRKFVQKTKRVRHINKLTFLLDCAIQNCMEKKVHIYGLVTASNEAVQRSRLTGPEVLTSVLDHPHLL